MANKEKNSEGSANYLSRGPQIRTKGIVIAGTHSGSGKTTVSLALMAAFRRHGLAIAPFKVGPDFIDPGHHRRVTRVTSRNLDGWMLSRAVNREIFSRNSAGADISVVEGVMGLYDGYDGKTEAGSTAQMAKWLDLPVLLVVDARSMARSAAAVVLGFKKFDPDCRFFGVVFNRVGSPAHLNYLKEAMGSIEDFPVLGGLPRDEQIQIPERHLGLVTTEDHGLSKTSIEALANLAENHINLNKLLEEMPEENENHCRIPGLGMIGKFSLEREIWSGGFDTAKIPGTTISPKPGTSSTAARPAPVRIGVAKDNAFCFYYPDNLEVLIENGARLIFFSPVEQENLPPDLDGLYLGGGYPELFAGKLSENNSMKNQIREKCDRGMPIYAECGGFMYLCDHLVDTEENRFEMAGCFPFTTRMKKRLAALGYREITLAADTPIGPEGMVARGHEFHYSYLLDNNGAKNAENVYDTKDRMGEEKRTCPGYIKKRCLGSYVHLHFRSMPEIGKNFVTVCRKYRKGRLG